MKNSIILFLFSLSILAVSCSKNNYGCTDPSSLSYSTRADMDDGSCLYPSFKKNVVVFEATSQACSYCGSWGVEYSNNLITQYSDVELIMLHGNDGFQSTLARNLILDLGNFGTPHFYVGSESMDNNYTVISSKVNTLINEPSDVALLMQYAIRGLDMNIDVQIRTKAANSEEYYMAVYVLEDKQKGYQFVNGGPTIQNFTHNHILRNEVSNSLYGIPIEVSEVITTKRFSVKLENENQSTNYPINTANCYPLVVIWKKTGSGFQFENCSR